MNRHHDRIWKKLGLEMLDRLQSQWAEHGQRLELLDLPALGLLSGGDIWFLWYLLRQELRKVRRGTQADRERILWLENCIRDCVRQV